MGRNDDDRLWQIRCEPENRFRLLTERGEVRPSLTNRQQVVPDLAAIAPLTAAEVDEAYRRAHGIVEQTRFVEWIAIPAPLVGQDFVYFYDRQSPAWVVSVCFTVNTSAMVVGRVPFISQMIGGNRVGINGAISATLTSSVVGNIVASYVFAGNTATVFGSATVRWIPMYFPRNMISAGMSIQSEMVTLGALQTTDQITGVWLQVEYL